jgi:hypothetical protein
MIQKRTGFLSKYFVSLSQDHSTNAPYFILLLRLSKEQDGEAWKPSEAVLFRISGATGEKNTATLPSYG